MADPKCKDETPAECSGCLECMKEPEVKGLFDKCIEPFKKIIDDFIAEIRAKVIVKVCKIDKCGNEIDITSTALVPVDPANLKIGKKLKVPQPEFPVGGSQTFKGANGAVPDGTSGVYLTETFPITNPNECHKVCALVTFTPEISSDGSFHEVAMFLNHDGDGDPAGDTILTNDLNGDVNAQVTFASICIPGGDTVTLEYVVDFLTSAEGVGLGNTEIGVVMVPCND